MSQPALRLIRHTVEPGGQLLLVDQPPPDPQSPASRLCADCGRSCKHTGIYGPPTWDTIGEPGVYERVRHDERWYCLTHGLPLWDLWRWQAPRIQQRRLEINAWLQRTK